MKVTKFGDGIPVTLQGWSTGITSLNSNVTTTDGGLSALNFVQRVTANGSNILLNPSVNIASGSGIALAASSNTVTISATGGGSGTISAGSNSTNVREISTAGASSTLWSPYDHAHGGVSEVTASSSNTLQRGTVNLRAGTGIALALTDTDGDGEFDTATIVNTGTSSGGGGGTTITTKDEGSTLSTGVTTLDFVGAGVTASGAGATTTITIAGGSGGGHRDPLDQYTLDGTYGDDFTGAALSGIWTRRNFTSGAETYQLEPTNSFMRIAMTGRAVGDGYFQTAPAGDWTFMMSYVQRRWGNGGDWGIACVNSSGTGLGTTFGNVGSQAFLIASITTYSTYGGAFVQSQQDSVWQSGVGMDQRKVWQYLRKSGTSYFGSVSLNGETWEPETAAFVSAFTVDRIGMLAHPVQAIVTTALIDIDVFNKIA